MRFSNFPRPALLAFALIAMALPILPFSACSSTGASNKSTPLVASPSPPIADVPIPVGFHMTPDSTSSLSPATGRVVDHRYKGSDDVLPIVKFYRDQMPENGWTPGDQTQARGGEITLHFTKGNEQCVVTVTPGGGWNNYIRVTIDPTGKR